MMFPLLVPRLDLAFCNVTLAIMVGTIGRSADLVAREKLAFPSEIGMAEFSAVNYTNLQSKEKVLENYSTKTF